MHEYLKAFFLENTLKNHKINLDSDIDTIIRKLSGGEKQRLNLIRALLRKPDMLILDEPTSALDIHTSEKILNHIFNHVSTVIFITHAPQYIQRANEVLDFNALVNAK